MPRRPSRVRLDSESKILLVVADIEPTDLLASGHVEKLVLLHACHVPDESEEGQIRRGNRLTGHLLGIETRSVQLERRPSIRKEAGEDGVLAPRLRFSWRSMTMPTPH